MKKLPVRLELFIGHEDLYKGRLTKKKRIALISKYSKRELLAVLAMINIFPRKNKAFHTYDWNEQIHLIRKLCLPDEDLFADIITRIRKKSPSLIRQNARPIIINRVANLLAIEEILSTDEIPHKSKKTTKPEDIFKYYLSINSLIKEKQDAYDYSDKKFLDLYPVLAVHNEHLYPFTPFLDLFRGIHLAEYLENDSEIGADFKQYFEKIGYEPKLYYPLIFSQVLPAINKKEDDTTIFKPATSVERGMIDSLSNKDIIESKDIFELINLKRNVFYPWDKEASILLDVPLLIDNTFYFTINSFWFNHLKPKKYKVAKYFSKIGLFYEDYVSSILRRCTHFLKYPKPKFLDELKIVEKGKGTLELADVYIRQNKKVILGEIKSSSFGTNFKFANDQIKSFTDNIKRFKKDFGITQVATSVANFLADPSRFDDRAKKNTNYSIFPVIFFNERLFQAPFTNLVFHNLYIEELEKQIGKLTKPKHEFKFINYGKVKLHPLSLIHTTELETIEPALVSRTEDIFKLLKNHHRIGLLHSPFYYVLHDRINSEFADYGMNLIRPIIEEFDKKRRKKLKKKRKTS